MKINNLLALNRTLIMGILNITPDSFSDGGEFLDAKDAVARTFELDEEGADIVDIGGESTRPGSKKISVDEELQRVLPVIALLKKHGFNKPLSIDTYKAQVALKALEAGVEIVNDISGGTFEPDIMKHVADKKAYYVIMHILGTPENMQEKPQYSSKGVVSDVFDYFCKRIEAAEQAGIQKDKIILDPGIGFGKSLKENYEIIRNIEEFRKLGKKILIGTSRKSMIGKVINKDVDDRIFGTAASVCASAIFGADIVRVHDVSEMKDVLKITDAITGKTELKDA